MSYNIEIKVFGKVSDAEAIHAVAEAVCNEEGLDESVEASEVVDQLVAASGRTAIEFSGNGYDDVFEGVTEACQQAGLSYVWTIGDESGEGPTNGKAWKPGMSEEIEFLIHEKSIGVPLKALAGAANNGPEAVTDLIATYAAATRVGRVDVEPGFVEAYKAFVDDLEGREDDDEDTGYSARP